MSAQTADGSPIRAPAVAGSFYPSRPQELAAVVGACIAPVEVPVHPEAPMGGLVPHAGLVYSGTVAAAGWRALLHGTGQEPVVIILGTNHSAWFEGVAVYASGAWRQPAFDVPVDAAVGDAVLGLGAPFLASTVAHRDEHSIEVQLPIVTAIRPRARIVPCSVSAGTGPAAVEAGELLGELMLRLRADGVDVRLAISTDMAHYPAHDEAVRVTARILPAITALDPIGTAALEHAAATSGVRGMACGMCGIQPTVLGLAALRAVGARRGDVVAAATSCDAGGPSDRTVGYLAVVFS